MYLSPQEEEEEGRPAAVHRVDHLHYLFYTFPRHTGGWTSAEANVSLLTLNI